MTFVFSSASPTLNDVTGSRLSLHDQRLWKASSGRDHAAGTNISKLVRVELCISSGKMHVNDLQSGRDFWAEETSPIEERETLSQVWQQARP